MHENSIPGVALPDQEHQLVRVRLASGRWALFSVGPRTKRDPHSVRRYGVHLATCFGGGDWVPVGRGKPLLSLQEPDLVLDETVVAIEKLPAIL